MPIYMKPTSVIIANLGLQNKGPVHAFFTDSCARHNDRYVPFRTGSLAETVILNGQPTANVKVDHYIYDQEYARYVYYGISKSGKQMVYSKNMHEDAGPYWDKRMWSAEKNVILKEVQDYINRGEK